MLSRVHTSAHMSIKANERLVPVFGKIFLILTVICMTHFRYIWLLLVSCKEMCIMLCQLRTFLSLTQISIAHWHPTLQALVLVATSNCLLPTMPLTAHHENHLEIQGPITLERVYLEYSWHSFLITTNHNYITSWLCIN